MDKNNAEPEPMDTETSDCNCSQDQKITEEARTRRNKYIAIGEESRRKTIMASGKHFIIVFINLLKETNADPKDRFQYLQRVCHSIFFFGHINLPQIQPYEFIPTNSWNLFQDKFGKALEEYKTHFPRQTPYSILLEYITKIYGNNHASLWEELEKRNKDLFNCCDDEKNQLPAQDFALSAAVITQSCVNGPHCDNNTAYGASIAYKGKVPRKIMIAISSLFVWDKVISYAVRSEDKGNGIQFPNRVLCQSYRFETTSQKFKPIPPCVKCLKMFIVQFDPEHVETSKKEEWRYGNCAETESLSNLIHSNEKIGTRVFTFNNGEKMSRETIIEKFNAEHKGKMEKELKNYLVSRNFKVDQKNWALFTPADYSQL